MLPRVMISYNSAQSDFANALKGRLRAAGLDVWFDRERIKPGTPWREGFINGIRDSDVFIPILSKGFLESSHCRLEVLTARSFGKKIVPVMVEDCLKSLQDHPETQGIQDIFMMFFTDLMSVGVPMSEDETYQRVVEGILFDEAAAGGISPAPPVYVAHVWKEAAFADRLARGLAERGQATWIAARNIPAGVRWFDEQVRAIHRAKAMIVVLDEGAPDARHLRTEVALAGVLGLRVLPVLADTVKGNWNKRKGLSDGLRRHDDWRPLYDTEPFTSDPDWTAMLEALNAALPATAATA